jgi:hypothetical protein
MGAGHLDDEGALNLISGLGALDERQADVHSDWRRVRSEAIRNLQADE